jgi:arsenite methyltransferase
LGTFIKNESDIDKPEIVACIDELPFWSAPFCLKLLDVIKYNKNITVLDVGFGTGTPLLEIAQRLGNSCKVYGIDPWDGAIERCKLKQKTYGINNVEIIKGFAESLPFENDFFDLIVSNNGLNNVEDAQQALYECGRVSKQGAQFVITFNLPDTMKDFYEIYISVLGELKLAEEIQKVNEHIFRKRKPLDYTLKQIVNAGFRIQNFTEDSFSYKYSDGTSMLNHYFIRLAFLPCWKELLPDIRTKEVFKIIEDKLNCVAAENNGICLSVPFACIEAYKN